MGGAFTADGHFAIVPGKQAMVVTVDSYKLNLGTSAIETVRSFPKTIRIAAVSNGHLTYALDKPILVTGFHKISQPAGQYRIGQ